MSKKSHSAQRGSARSQRPERNQVEMQLLSIDQWLDENHRVRWVWQYVETLDLSDLYDKIRAVQGHAGRSPVDPRILFCLWLYATIDGVTSARRLEKLTKEHIAYLWICGGVSVNYHLLADFRTAHGEFLHQLLTNSIAVLVQQELVTLETIGQDGMRVRANAGSSSFHREKTLNQALKEAQRHVQSLSDQDDSDPASDQKRSVAAKKRAAVDRADRISEALKNLDELQASRQKKKRDDENARASTTDPEARKTKMGDGGFRPAFNVQFATDGQTRLIVGVEVNNRTSDASLMKPMRDRLVSDYGVKPREYLVDGPYATIDDVTALETDGTKVYAPVPHEQKLLEKGEDPYRRRKRDTDAMAGFRHRMSTAEGKAKYKQRPSIAEFPNADCRNRNLKQFSVRGIVKATSQVLWHVLAFNLMRFRNLGFLPTH